MSHKPTDMLTVGEFAQRAGIATSAVRFDDDQESSPRNVHRGTNAAIPATYSSHQHHPGRPPLRRHPRRGRDNPRRPARRPDAQQDRLDPDIAALARTTASPPPRNRVSGVQTHRLYRMRDVFVTTCRIVNPDDQLSQQGPGPRRLIPTHNDSAGQR